MGSSRGKCRAGAYSQFSDLRSGEDFQYSRRVAEGCPALGSSGRQLTAALAGLLHEQQGQAGRAMLATSNSWPQGSGRQYTQVRPAPSH